MVETLNDVAVSINGNTFGLMGPMIGTTATNHELHNQASIDGNNFAKHFSYAAIVSVQYRLVANVTIYKLHGNIATDLVS
ncbi:hypothetical protein SCA6_015495 [Theobroma cacao]